VTPVRVLYLIMKYPENRNIHRPVHMYLKGNIYFISAHTFNNLPYFKSDTNKEIWIKTIKGLISDIKLYAWFIGQEHYHVLLKFTGERNISYFTSRLHSTTSKEINKRNNSSGRRIWYQYWDYCIRNEKDFYVHFNYIHNNPIKHGYIKQVEQLKDYIYSSYPTYLKRKGVNWLNDLFERYPIIDFSLKREDDYR